MIRRPPGPTRTDTLVPYTTLFRSGELALHYQINSGLDDWPIFIGNLRYKSPSGEGPFDVDRDANGLESELATGSGFHGIEPSVTIRSEEHTSELQSLMRISYAVFCLKKKKTEYGHTH